ncbi:MAG TPA: folylpolyglutamate synthase/dihydrofolate synthase family protein [Vicinamibacterales bacterium]|nr:folylpolyglutamate synthase/dihydrofolate synthase family protein [Vicinamibacterales bacterium]
MTPIERLFSLEQFGIKLGLDNIRIILAALGHPERAWKSIHIGGTNGKGSVAAMVECGLRAAGLKTGRYTSPHLDRIEERVAINGSSIDSATFESVTAQVLEVVDASMSKGTLTVTPTFFEVSTAIAFQIFKRAAVDVAVVEVGLGGRFDATNVLTPAITAITSIAFDHEKHLGHTLSEIAFEKAGIAKPGVPLVVGHLPAEAAERIARVAREVGAPLLDAHATSDRKYPPLTLALPGRHQLENAAVAVAILECWSTLIGHVSTEAIVRGLTQCEWPARLEWLHVPPDGELLIDAAHNPAGAAALASYLQDTGRNKLPIVFAAMADKDLTNMIGPLAPVASAFIATTVPNARARSAEQLAAEIRRLTPLPVEALQSPEAAVTRALEPTFAKATVGRPRRAVACGSIYMIGPLRARLLEGGATRL